MALGALPSRKQILANFAALVSGMGFARLMTAVALILLARQVGPSAYGQYLACFSLARLTSVAFSWGLDSWILWRGSNASKSELAVQSGNTLTWKLSLGFLWLGGLYLASRVLNPEVFPPVVLMTTALFVWTDDMTNTAWSVFKSTLRNDVTLKLIAPIQLGLVLVTLALIYAGAQYLLPFLWGRLAVSALGCLVGIALLRRNFGLGFERTAMAPMLRAAAPFAVSLMLALIYERVDVTIVAQFLGAEQAGIYGPASTITTTLFLVPLAAYSVMVPVFTRAYAADDRSFAQTLRLFVVANTVMGAVLAGALALSASWVVARLYGAQYVASGPLLAILSLVLGLRCVTFALAAAVVATGRQTRRLYVQGVAAALSVFVNLAIVNAFGVRGVAWVYVFTEAVILVGYWLALGAARPWLLRRPAP
ncbi:MAG: oligosaccharide flippase family protein [Anaerolineae bacterium]|jgi:O-antigen/teichoic acid export membrane protein|nr:oligosaccharide flippase family protein [Anaerolineae bacterium]